MTNRKPSDAFDRAVNCKHSSALERYDCDDKVYVRCDIYLYLTQPVEGCKICKYYKDERI